jgi:dUTP pyrophosphatase
LKKKKKKEKKKEKKMSSVLKVKRLSEKATLPIRSSKLAAGYDLFRFVFFSFFYFFFIFLFYFFLFFFFIFFYFLFFILFYSAIDLVIPGKGKSIVPTDLSIAVNEGTYARIAPRSGLATKYFIDVGAGVIDADYRGNVGVVLFNFSDQDFQIKIGDRIAQLIIEKIETPEIIEVDDLNNTERGNNGFGSTGK